MVSHNYKNDFNLAVCLFLASFEFVRVVMLSVFLSFVVVKSVVFLTLRSSGRLAAGWVLVFSQAMRRQQSAAELRRYPEEIDGVS